MRLFYVKNSRLFVRYRNQEIDIQLQEPLRACAPENGCDMFQRADHPRLCSLDFLCPDGMPPNVELTASDLRDGEVISGIQTGYQRNISRNTQVPVSHSMHITHPVMDLSWLQSL
ncbi:hypothetical protein CHS0354_010291 [Potamilus streckersoni]|uniref:Uncharacterized protein n=1 Tax=Potamilus streckersoni TaxID=2493646 RepID=A0AAE0WAJ3_9BIVA|nr:hypothetical protein CHS0354_010291 [Potamilus streckersoni]